MEKSFTFVFYDIIKIICYLERSWLATVLPVNECGSFMKFVASGGIVTIDHMGHVMVSTEADLLNYNIINIYHVLHSILDHIC